MSSAHTSKAIGLLLTIPIDKLLPGLPRSTFFSGAAAFLGGIRDFLAGQRVETEKQATSTEVCLRVTSVAEVRQLNMSMH